jgi:hypothetical protein
MLKVYLCRRTVAVLQVACLVLFATQSHAQSPVQRIQKYRSVVSTDSKGNDKAISIEFSVTSDAVVSHATLYYRASGGAGYSDERLKINRELFYEGSVPYAGKIEYYLAVVPETGPPFFLGSPSAPEVLQSEDLPRAVGPRHERLKHAVTFGAIVMGAVVFAILGTMSVGGGRVATSNSASQQR